MSKQKNNVSELSTSLRNKYQMLLSASENLINRLNQDIIHIHSKNVNLIATQLFTISIIVTIFLYFIGSNWQPDRLDLIFIVAFLIVIALALYFSLKNFFPQEIKDINILEQERFNKISELSEEDLYSDLLNNLKEDVYKFNLDKYNVLCENFRISLILFLSATIPIILLIIKPLLISIINYIGGILNVGG